MKSLVGYASETHQNLKNQNNDGIPLEQLLTRHKSDRKTIIGIDGEGVTAEHQGDWRLNQQSAEHLYTLLAASNGEYVENAQGLGTEQCFNFLLSLVRDVGSNYLLVGFSIGYDINMMLKDLPLKHVEHLIKNGHVYWQHWSIKMRTHRTFQVRDRRTHKSIMIYDVFGFFQCSFVKALRTWNVGSEQEINDISAMKEQRGEFDLEHTSQIRTYCFKECDLLVELMGRLIDAVNGAEIPCHHWYGVGALASGLMRKFKIKNYLDAPPIELSIPVLSAYYGGRFEIAGTGHFGKVYGYDIKSAYPSIARSLPCLKHTTYTHYNSYSLRSNRIALCHVVWDVDRNARWGPFPWRTAHKQIYYPLNGEGWYWSVEVAAAKRIFGDDIRIVEAYELETSCVEVPFHFINAVYEERQRLEANGDFANKALKLALNALYGKCAQSLGGKRKPPYQSYIWAGLITAGTRAQILDAIRTYGDSIISIATDGILSTEPMKVKIGKALGQWETTTWNQCFLVQPGIYRLSNNATDKIEHTRGFGSKETDFDAIERDYVRNPLGKHEYKAVRFVSAAAALAHNDTLEFWRRWIETKRVINFGQARRMITPESLVAARNGVEPVMHDAVHLSNVVASTPYEPKQSWLDSWIDDVDVLLDMEQP